MNTRKVLFLGAGASVPAGYPPTSSLLEKVAEEAKSSLFPQFRNAWQSWTRYLASSPPWLRLVLKNPNPEVALTLPDLFELAIHEQDRSRSSQLMRRARKGKDTSQSIVRLEAYYKSEKRATLAKARTARRRLIDALQWYFTFKLGDKGVTDRTEYLRNQLSALSTGDVVITTNWDPLVEQLLAQEGRWIPTDGYGFQRGMGLLSGLRRVALPGGLGVVSEIQVLKLHGCFGWRDLDDGFFLEGNEFLSQFRFAFEGRRIQMRDMDEPTSYRPSNPIIAFPSYLKSLIHSTLFEVWRTASLVISDCSDFAAAGYSLPASDSAVRALLLPIANGARTGRVRVTIADPAKATLDTWREFLGHNPKFLQLGLEAAPVLLDG